MVPWYYRTMITDDALLAGFDDATLPGADFRHAEHVRAAFLHLRREGDLARATTTFRTALRQFAEVNGAPGKYDEALTQAWLALVHEAMGGHADRTSLDLLARRPDLLEVRRVRS